MEYFHFFSLNKEIIRKDYENKTHKMQLKNLFLIYLCLISGTLYAQETMLKGKITDSETGEILPFATIKLENQSRGTIANAEGIYQLDLTGIQDESVVIFSYVGYESPGFIVKDLKSNGDVKLDKAVLQLENVEVYSRQLTAEEIVEKVKEKFSENHPNSNLHERIFLHRFERTPFDDKNKIKVKKSDFVGLDKNTIEEAFNRLPDEFVEYQDAVFDLYTHGDSSKLIAREAISLQESSMEDLSNEMETRFGDFIEDLEKTREMEGVYYKFRSGIFASKMDMDSEEENDDENDGDSVHYVNGTRYVKSQIQQVIDNYARLQGEHWEFLQESGRYDFKIDEVTVFNDEVVYKISFKPGWRGLYRGFMYVSTRSYAILEIDFEYAPGKSSENIKILGIGHSLKYRKGRVIYEKGENGYFPKFIQAQRKEWARIDRDFALRKKQERFLFDKELNEITMHAYVEFDIDSQVEILFMEREPIQLADYTSITEPVKVKYKIEYSNSPNFWKGQSIIAPTAELEKYKRKEDGD